MSDNGSPWLVTTDWLAEHLDAPDIAIVDATWYLPGVDRDPHGEFREERIPGAVFFDIDEIADTQSDLPHMLPSPVKFSARMRKLGIGDGMRIVVYDRHGLFSAARVWWTFRVMGVDDVAILDGGLPKWLREDRPVTDGPTRERGERHFTARRRAELVRDVDDVRAVVAKGGAQIIDARAPERFFGQAPEPRAGLRSGHMPGAINLPFNALLNKDGTLLPAEEIRATFATAGINPSQPVINTCGSGITASVVSFALALIGNPAAAVYDGSWTEWGAREDLPIVTNDT